MQKIVLLLTILFSCTGFSQHQKEIDSLLHVVSQIAKPTPQYENLNNRTEKILKLSTEAYYQSKETGYTEGQINTLLLITQNLKYIGDLKSSLERNNEGLKLTQGNDRYLSSYIHFLLMKGSTLSQLGYFDDGFANYDKATEVMKQLPEYAADAGHYRKILKQNQIILAWEQNKSPINLSKKEREHYLLDSYHEIQLIKNNTLPKDVLQLFCIASIVTAYAEWGELDKAEYYWNKGNSLYKDRFAWKMIGSFLRGHIEKKRKNYPKALELYNAALKIAKQDQHIYDEKEIYIWIAECYKGLSDYRNESYYLGKQKKLSDSIDVLEKVTTSNVLKNEIKNKDSNSSFFTSNQFYYPAVAILVLLLLLYFLLKHRFSKRKESVVLQTTEYPEEVDVMPRTEANDTDIDQEKLHHIIMLAEQNTPSFYLKFQEIFPKFNQTLLNINPKLTQSDLEYCAMMKLNFDTKKIAGIKKASVAAIESKKYRIRKKLDISSEENIYIWLMDK